MPDDIYSQLADALNRLPNGFPRTESNVEVRLLKKIFSPDDAALGSRLRGNMENVDIISRTHGTAR